MLPAVNVPVLSVHKTSVLPKSSIDINLLTMTCFFDIFWAPFDKLMVIITGNNSGDIPTAIAKAKSNDSIQSCLKIAKNKKIPKEKIKIIRNKNMPKLAMPF